MYYKAPDNSLHYLDDDNFLSLLPAGSVPITDAEAKALTAPPPPTAQQIEAQFAAAIQHRLDTFAQTRNYDNMLSACTYATSMVPKFKAEGQACINLRDDTWAAAYDILGNVKAGVRAMPKSLADLEAELPVLVWP